MRLAPLALASLAAAGCASEAASSPEDGGPPSCDVLISTSPPMPFAGDTVTATASIDSGGLSGIYSFSWSVERGGVPVSYSDQSVDGDVISFVADQAGVYDLVASGSVGGLGCVGDSASVNVLDPNGQSQDYRLRVVPSQGEAPPQDLPLTVYGGVPDYVLGDVSVAPGISANGTATGPGGPIQAYLRATGPGAVPIVVEGFASDTGAFSMLLPAAVYDVLVVPQGAAAATPVLLTGVSAVNLGGAISVPAGDTVTGTVSDPSGAPVSGATVSLVVNGVPSTLATTDGTGAFSAGVRAGSPAVITVVPPASSGLPQLVVNAGAAVSLSDGSAIDIDYAASITSRSVAPALRQSDGTTPAAGARLTLVARPMAGAGTVVVDSGTPVNASGRVRVSATADGSGTITALTIPEWAYDAVVEPAGVSSDAATVSFVDLGTGQSAPFQLSLSAPATISVAVRDAAGTPLPGARLTALPGGLLANAPSAMASGVTDANGAAQLSVAAGASYSVQVDGGASRGHGRTAIAVTAPAAGQTSAVNSVDLPVTSSISGRLLVTGGGALQRAQLAVLCDDCNGVDAAVPVAEGSSDATGNFTLLVPDPGVSP